MLDVWIEMALYIDVQMCTELIMALCFEENMHKEIVVINAWLVNCVLRWNRNVILAINLLRKMAGVDH